MQPMRQSVTSLVLAALGLGGLAGHAGPLHAQAAAEPESWVVIDAQASLEQVSASIDRAVADRGWR